MPFKLAVVFGSVFALAGCASQEGVGFARDPYINKGIAKHAALPPGAEVVEAEETNERSEVASVIVIGRTSAYRDIPPEDAEHHYERYRESYEAWGVKGEPSMSFADFQESIAGWTRIKLAGVPLLFASYVKALVPRDVLGEVGFQDSFNTVLFQMSSDLVAAKSNPDGALEVVALLCKDEFGSSDCDSAFRKGVYDAATGTQLEGKFELKEDGARIDPATYELKEDPR
jgi:hypothetical protein